MQNHHTPKRACTTPPNRAPAGEAARQEGSLACRAPGALKRAAALVSAMILLTACTKDSKKERNLFEPTAAERTAPLSVEEKIAQTFAISKTEPLLVLSGYAPTIRGNGPFTILTIWNGGSDSSGIGPIYNAFKDNNRPSMWKLHAWAVMDRLTHDGDIGKSEVENGASELKMRDGSTVAISHTPRNKFNNILSIADYDASNGYLWMLDDALMPLWWDKSTLDVISELPDNYSDIKDMVAELAKHLEAKSSRDPDEEELLKRLKATDVMSLEKPITFFAPTNSALAGVAPASKTAVCGPAGSDQPNWTETRKFVEAHIADYVMRKGHDPAGLPTGASLNDGLVWDRESGSITRAGTTATIVAADANKTSSNGIVHGVDKALPVPSAD